MGDEVPLAELLGSSEPPKPEPLPEPIKEVDVSAQKQYTKKRAKKREGRESTILASKLNAGTKETLR
jgi:hypothetical protein